MLRKLLLLLTGSGAGDGVFDFLAQPDGMPIVQVDGSYIIVS